LGDNRLFTELNQRGKKATNKPWKQQRREEKTRTSYAKWGERVEGGERGGHKSGVGVRGSAGETPNWKSISN